MIAFKRSKIHIYELRYTYTYALPLTTAAVMNYEMNVNGDVPHRHRSLLSTYQIHVYHKTLAFSQIANIVYLKNTYNLPSYCKILQHNLLAEAATDLVG